MLQFYSEHSRSGNTIRVKSFFFQENEDITSFFYRERVFLGNISLNDLQRSQNNNRIGFMQCHLKGNEYVKIYTIPKTVQLSPEVTEQDALGHFNQYFAEYLRLRSIYSQRGFKVIADNIIDVERVRVDSVENYLVKRYERALNEVLSFFKRHSRERLLSNEFKSQSITNGINLKRNITELNKSNVHQVEEIKYNYSRFAEIAFATIECFRRERLLLFTNSLPLEVAVQRLSVYLRKYLSGKFLLNTTTSGGTRVFERLQSRLFDKTPETKRLRENLMILIGAESQGQYHKVTNIDSVWFSPEYMYELMVCDHFEQIADKIGISISPKPTMNYNLLVDSKPVLTNQSIPDLILNVMHHNVTVIIDSKWKRISDWSDIQLDDILKIYRDKCVFKRNGCPGPVIVLTYPSIAIPKDEYLGRILSHTYNDEVAFLIMEVAPFNLHNTGLFARQLLLSLGRYNMDS